VSTSSLTGAETSSFRELGLEIADFANAIRTGSEPRSHSRLGLEVVRSLEAAHISMERSGDPIQLSRADQSLHSGCDEPANARLERGRVAVLAPATVGT
jgi:hypothetical protein